MSCETCGNSGRANSDCPDCVDGSNWMPGESKAMSNQEKVLDFSKPVEDGWTWIDVAKLMEACSGLTLTEAVRRLKTPVADGEAVVRLRDVEHSIAELQSTLNYTEDGGLENDFDSGIWNGLESAKDAARELATRPAQAPQGVSVENVRHWVKIIKGLRMFTIERDHRDYLIVDYGDLDKLAGLMTAAISEAEQAEKREGEAGR